ncbi:zinc finger CCCH domain-containing protein 24 [Ziziphus jujuba]|uniref:Zinc finger CCCH domain-containing protein 24 n=1 Tax=Ziziphus jujuba TaxID=326968 RepID=A0ABM3I9Q7_ZIZJJ|nr:zinc finger CCCH domain-containing protein 24 [Ziziphus jujuba]
MAASPNYEASISETLNPSIPDPPQPSIPHPVNGHDSTNEPPPNPTNQQPSVPPSMDDTNSGEKRKREDDSAADRSTHPLWKTSLCSYFRRDSGSCSHGSECRYAHGEEELRMRPDNTWDPTSERAKKAMKISDEDGGKKCGVSVDVMMTEAVVDEEGGGPHSGLGKCLVHVPRSWKSDKLIEFLTEQGIAFKSVKKKKGMTVGFVSFETMEQLQTATEKLDGQSIGNKNLKVRDVIGGSCSKKTYSTMALPQNTQKTAEDALPRENADVPASLNGTGDGDTNEGDANEGNTTVDDFTSSGRTARDVVTPLAHMPYADQLEHKKNSIMQILKKLTRNARKACPTGVSLPEWILKSREIGGLPCNLEGILASPLVNEYRNKCEFSVGYSLQGKITVGFMLGNFREGVTAVEEPIDCPNVSRIACKYASMFQEFLQNSSLPVWNRFKNTGFWRQLTVREGRKPEKASDAENFEANIAEVLLMVQVSTLGFDDALITSEFEKLSQVFSAGAAKNFPPLPLTAIVVQDHQGISNVAPADIPLRPLLIPKAICSPEQEAINSVEEARIHDYVSCLRFRISPTAFFQVNTLAAEKLYSLAGDWAGLGADTLLFDICCGTGTIGLTLAHRVGMVVGIEMNASAVSDAHRNAEINGIKNCRFVCGKAEDVMGSLLKEYVSMSQKQNGILDIPESSDKLISTAEENNISTDNSQNPETKSGTSVGNLPDPEESSTHALENGKTASDSLESSMQDLGSKIQNWYTSESGNPQIQQFKDVVAIVDPPRGGLHPTVIKALRTHPCLRRLVYISCNPESLVANAIELCTPSAEKIERGNKGNRGWRNMSSAGLARQRVKSMPVSEPFRPVKAMAVDLFPHTLHCEMVMLLER